MSLSLRGLTVRQGGATLIEGITLDIAPARLTGLIGVNGAGKSTLMRAALGLIPARGTSDLAALPLARRARRAAWLPQSREVAWPIPVAELVRLGCPPDAAGRQGDGAVAEALSAVGAAHLGARIATGLSGGELARVLIARLIAQQTPIILADEPVAGLDPAQQLAVMALFRRLAQQGRTVLVSIHDLGLAARYCDRLILMDGGRVTADGSPAEVLTPPILRRSFGIGGAFVDTAAGPAFVTLPV